MTREEADGELDNREIRQACLNPVVIVNSAESARTRYSLLVTSCTGRHRPRILSLELITSFHLTVSRKFRGTWEQVK